MFKKSLAIGFLAAMSFGSVASAESYFTCMNPLPKDALLDLGTITAEGEGVVEIYDFRLGKQGDLLGTTNVNQGANSDVRLNIGMPPMGDILAVLNVNGEVVASKVYEVCDE